MSGPVVLMGLWRGGSGFTKSSEILSGELSSGTLFNSSSSSSLSSSSDVIGADDPETRKK